ncbi:MAG: 50S ribosomal protein L3 [Candidatus Nealsonbacteria bacterium DGGOD1a]|jgi:LSU ribosomal protein L3P|nr:MAG: 50S ribosomal protein L3 [Candidatus Nealsonbacteria bacterium DGGOD1a]
MKFILGKKIGMTEIFAAGGKRMPVTMIEAGPCRVTQLKTKENDGYAAVQLGFGDIDSKRVKKSQAGKPFRTIKEYRGVDGGLDLKAGDSVKVDSFKEGDVIKVSGLSKGKGFQGAVKKHGFKGRLSCTHGTKHELRNVGSVGMGGAAIRKGKKMPGRMGVDRVTVKNLKIVMVDAEKNLMAILGAVPGRKGTLLEIRG